MVEISESENGSDSKEKKNNNNNNTVEIILKTIGPLRPSRIIVPSRLKVNDLRKLLAENKALPIESLSIILRGSILLDKKNGDDVIVELKEGDCVTVAIKPKAQVRHSRAGFDDDEDEEDDLKFHLPESANWWKQRLFRFLHDKLKLPDIVLMAIFSLSLKAWVLIILWFILAPVAHRWDFGPIFILVTGFAIIFLNLGRRQEGDVSAYSIFNEDFQELPGTLNADRIDRDIRAGQL